MAASLNSGSVLTEHPLPGTDNAGLVFDSLYLPSQTASAPLVVMVSGIHGIEAFAGSAVQRHFLRRILPAMDQGGVSCLLIHAVNAWGCRNGRRVTANNVDLNRNFLDWDCRPPTNVGYSRLAPFLNPSQCARSGYLDALCFALRLLGHRLTMCRRELSQAVLQGQYSDPRGVYFGGATLEPHVEMLRDILVRFGSGAAGALVLDLHTGFGRRGALHLFSSLPPDPVRSVLECRVFAGFPIDQGATDPDFYSTSGDFNSFADKLFRGMAVPCVPMTLEFGTLNTQTLAGAIKALLCVVRENCVTWHGAESEAIKADIRGDFREAYDPSDPSWRSSVGQLVSDWLPRFVRNFSGSIGAPR